MAFSNFQICGDSNYSTKTLPEYAMPPKNLASPVSSHDKRYRVGES